MIEVENVAFKFNQEQTLNAVSLQVAPGEIVALLGPSGIGKTTLLRCIGGLLRPLRGEIRIAGLAPEEAAKRQKIGYLFQQDSLLEWRNVRENVALPFEAAAASGHWRGASEIDSRLNDALRLVGLSQATLKFPRQLSGGMRQRAALARALAPEPSVLLLDEPFAAIDLLTRERIMIELHAILRKSTTPTLVVTHHIEEAVFLSDRIVLLGGKPATIVASWAVEFGRERTVDLLMREDFIHLVVDMKASLRSFGGNEQ